MQSTHAVALAPLPPKKTYADLQLEIEKLINSIVVQERDELIQFQIEFIQKELKQPQQKEISPQLSIIINDLKGYLEKEKLDEEKLKQMYVGFTDYINNERIDAKKSGEAFVTLNIFAIAEDLKGYILKEEQNKIKVYYRKVREFFSNYFSDKEAGIFPGVFSASAFNAINKGCSVAVLHQGSPDDLKDEKRNGEKIENYFKKLEGILGKGNVSIKKLNESLKETTLFALEKVDDLTDEEYVTGFKTVCDSEDFRNFYLVFFDIGAIFEKMLIPMQNYLRYQTENVSRYLTDLFADFKINYKHYMKSFPKTFRSLVCNKLNDESAERRKIVYQFTETPKVVWNIIDDYVNDAPRLFETLSQFDWHIVNNYEYTIQFSSVVAKEELEIIGSYFNRILPSSVKITTETWNEKDYSRILVDSKVLLHSIFRKDVKATLERDTKMVESLRESTLNKAITFGIGWIVGELNQLDGFSGWSRTLNADEKGVTSSYFEELTDAMKKLIEYLEQNNFKDKPTLELRMQTIRNELERCNKKMTEEVSAKIRGEFVNCSAAITNSLEHISKLIEDKFVKGLSLEPTEKQIKYSW